MSALVLLPLPVDTFTAALHALLVTLSSSVLLFLSFTLVPTLLLLLLLSDLSCVQSVVVGMPPVSQVSMMEEQQRQNNMVRPAVDLRTSATCVQAAYRC